MIKLMDILLEMAKTDIHYQTILKAFVDGDVDTKRAISTSVSGQPHNDQARLENDLLHMDYDDVIEIERELDLATIEEACWDGYKQQGMKKKGDKMVPNCVRVSEAKKKGKINPAYLTKDAAAMRKEIDRVKKLKSDDPSAYGKWEADYADKAKTKKYKTKKSAATSAYEKRFGKKEKVKEEKAHEKEMIDGIVDILKQVKDIQNRKKMAIDQLKDFKKEDIRVDEKEFLKRCGL
jgi:hypothetical protein